MELRTIQTFLKVAELHSFSKAAGQLGYSQSTVTIHVQQLEKELQVQLFDRINKTVRLTQEGQTFATYARQLVQISEEARTAIQMPQTLSGDLRIATADSICTTFFPQILQEYHLQHPHVELFVKPAGTEEMFWMLQHNEVDSIYTLDRRIFQPDFVKLLDAEEPICFVTSPDHPLAGQKSVSIEQILQQELILTERGMSYRDALTERLSMRGLELRPFLEVGNTNLICQLLRSGIGISFLPEYLVREYLLDGSLVRLPVADPSICMWRQMFCHRDKWITPQMQAMIDLVRTLDPQSTTGKE